MSSKKLARATERPTPRHVLAQPGFRARIAARALEDETFRRQLATRPRAALEAELSAILGRRARLPGNLRIEVHQESSNEFHFVCPSAAVVPREEANDLLVFWEHILRSAP